MAIYGVGIDIVDMERMQGLLRRQERFLDRVFTAKERTTARGVLAAAHYASRFAAKEAVLKALGTGLRFGIGWTEVEILEDDLGAPVAHLSGRAKTIAAKRRVRRIHISITHDRGTAAAVAVAEK